MLDIKDVKKGNLIECIKTSLGGSFTEGKVYTCSQDGLSYLGGVRVVEDDKGEQNGWSIQNFKLYEPKQDLRELLQVGQKISNEYQTEFIGDEIHLRDLKSRFNENLYSGLSKTTIDEIYRKKYNGIKPMEWALVWKREEELFALQCPITDHYLGYNYCDREKLTWTHFNQYQSYLSRGYLDNHKSIQRYWFTQKEIDNLPNQNLIKSLIKK